MFFNIKMLTLKKASVKIIILIIAGIMGILMFHQRTYDYFAGPEVITKKSFKYKEGKYVSYNLNDLMVLDCFLERKDKDLKGNIESYYYYILGMEDIDSNSVKCIVVMVDSEKMNIYNDYNRYFKNRGRGKTYSLPEPCIDKGTLVPMSSLIKSKLVQSLSENYGITYGDKVYCEPYCIIPYKPGIIDVSVCFVSVLFILVATAELVIICLGLKNRKIKKYLLKTGREGIIAAEKDYQYSRFFSKSIRIGDIYTFLFLYEGISLIENKKIIWIYECTATGESKGTKPNAGCSGIEIWDSEFNCYEIFINDRKMINSILDYMASQYLHIIVGYNNMLSNMFFNNNQQFKCIVYNKYSGLDKQGRTEEVYE